MFTRITYEVTFPTGLRAGQTLKGDWQINKGFTAIVGPNEAGKSMILELLRFSLFGSAALRGPTTDYRTLRVRTELELKGRPLVIERTISNAKVIEGGAVIVSGTKPVNQWIVKELGFGLDVFDVSNSINQGEVERLGNMRPTERQKLVDSTVGLDKIDALARLCSDRALGFEKEAQGILNVISEPERPEEPECWPNRQAMVDFLAKAEADAIELAGIEGELRAPRMPEPVKPTCSVQQTEAELTELADQRQRLREHIAALKARIATLPASVPYNHLQLDDAEAEWARYDRYVEAQAWLRAHPNPEHERQTCIDQLAAWDDLDECARLTEERRSLTARIEMALKQGACTGCGLPFAHDHIDELRAQLDAIVVSPMPEPPRFSRASLEAALRAWEGFDEQTYLQMRGVEALDPPSIPRAQIPIYRAQFAQVAEREELYPKLEASQAEFDAMPDYEIMLFERRVYDRDLAAFDARHAEWVAQEERIGQLLLKRDELEYAPARVAELRPIVARFEPYERELARYEQDLKRYQERKQASDDAFASAAKWRKAKDALTTLRGLIKQHLYPSLAKAASVFLAGMTGGERTRVDITDGFEVLIDGQSIDTLSGSGKAVANLAIRLGLGRVLTHSVFPVVLADEIDASMDDMRAEQTADILQQCAARLSQLLLVSHKTPEAEFYLNLGGVSE